MPDRVQPLAAHDRSAGGDPPESALFAAVPNNRGRVSPESRLITLPLHSIRRDGGTQNRLSVDPGVVKEYAALMRCGTVFPPVEVRYDGTDYWLSDGFQRLSAAALANLATFQAVVRPGTKEDAQWDSFAANACHGCRRTAAETARVVQLALQHPAAKRLSNVQIAKHLQMPEPTLRRWRKKLSSSSDEDAIRVVTRGKTTYDLDTTAIGGRKGRCQLSTRRIRRELEDMLNRSIHPTRG
jgi:hypothetical protein